MRCSTHRTCSRLLQTPTLAARQCCSTAVASRWCSPTMRPISCSCCCAPRRLGFVFKDYQKKKRKNRRRENRMHDQNIVHVRYIYIKKYMNETKEYQYNTKILRVKIACRRWLNWMCTRWSAVHVPRKHPFIGPEAPSQGPPSLPAETPSFVCQKSPKGPGSVGS